VARAKRTHRADARRRHRAQLAAQAELEGEGPEDALEPDAEVAAASRTAPTPAAAPRRAASRGRPADPLAPGPAKPPPAGGIRNAFRLAFRPLNLREDLALIPRLVLHRSFWLPALLSAVTAVAIIAFQGRELISVFAMTYFLMPPPIGAIFLAGFLAPRASYLQGAMVGIVASLLLAIVVAAVPSMFSGATLANALAEGLLTSPLAGVFFGSAAAWYRRFLYLASPARQAPPRRVAPASSKGKPVRGARSR
jgi:hypothetical protein